jgi:inhibitor of KinA sporulation pathway (predicted exonuclease)
LNIPKYLKQYINIKKYFVKIMKWKERSRGMMEMLEVLNIKHEGKHHSGIDDVRNICSICIQLIKSHGAKFPKK